MTGRADSHALWSVVLAAGAGRRLASVTGGTPKQFWSPDSGPSLVEATLARVAPLASRERTVVIVDRAHESYVRASAERWGAATVVWQPADRGTAAGVLLALTPVLDAEPDALVLVTPSDHGIVDDGRFRASIRLGAEALRQGRAQALVYGATPTSACPDYGWMVPGAPVGPSSFAMRQVRRFVEKPLADEVDWLAASGGVWSTMVILVRASVLRRAFALQAPQLAAIFYEYRRLAAADRPRFLAERYATLAAVDFSRDVLAHIARLAVHVWPASVGWADLGTPERLARWANREEAIPVRPAAHQAAS